MEAPDVREIDSRAENRYHLHWRIQGRGGAFRAMALPKGLKMAQNRHIFRYFTETKQLLLRKVVPCDDRKGCIFVVLCASASAATQARALSSESSLSKLSGFQHQKKFGRRVSRFEDAPKLYIG